MTISVNTPNEVTVAAIEEGDKLLNDPSSLRFSSIETLFEELNS